MKIILENFRVVDEDQDRIATVVIEKGTITEVLPASDASGVVSPALAGGAALYLQSAAFDAPAAGVGATVGDLPAPAGGIGATGVASLARAGAKADAATVGSTSVDLPAPAGAPNTRFCLMPAFVDLHAHFRDTLLYDEGFPAETLESASMAAAAGGFGTVVAMANTKPVIDNVALAAAIKARVDTIGLVDLYPVLSLTKNLDGKEFSEIVLLSNEKRNSENFSFDYSPLMLSEDGKDIADDDLFLAAMAEAKRLGIPISCHCDYGGEEAEAAKKAGQSRNVYSRIEENNATRRVIALAKKAGCHIHIAHVSTKEAMEMIMAERIAAKTGDAAKANTCGGFRITCEVMPHNLCLTEDDAAALGDESWGRVNPPLRKNEDRYALIQALAHGHIDAIATDHAPHSNDAKEGGAAGFTAFETAFAAAFTELVRSSEAAGAGNAAEASHTADAAGARNPAMGNEAAGADNASASKNAAEASVARARNPAVGSEAAGAGNTAEASHTAGAARAGNAAISLRQLSSLMSASPARLLGLGEGAPPAARRGRIAPGYKADLVIVDTECEWKVDQEKFKTRGRNSPFHGKTLFGRVLMTFHEGRLVFQERL